ncbi:MAG: formate dehydrogenase, partial [Pseudomonadales bacterium]|nr:formate dehydrogenase [Pseudomonadales bacterium]
MSLTRIYLPRETTALSVGAEQLLHQLQTEASYRGLGLEIVRNGSRGACWLEPLLEVETPAGRIAYGPVQPEDVASLFDAGFLQGERHPLYLGLVDDIPYFKNQERLTFARCGVIDPLSVTAYKNLGGFQGLERALAMSG